MLLSIKKNGKGYVTSYTVNIGCAAARRCGFVDEKGERFEIETVEMPEKNAFLVKLKKPSDT